MTALELLAPHEATPANEKWHELRRNAISASEIAAVLGISPWESAFSLYWRKVNGWEIEANDEMRAGTRAEPVIARWFEDWADEQDGDGPYRHVRAAGLYASDERPWQLATPDRLVMQSSGHPGVFRFGALLECKYLVHGWDGWGEPGTDDVPVHYRAQALQQLDVMEVDETFVAAWHGAEFRCYRVRRDEKDLRVMRAAGRDFMDRIAAGEPPPIDDHAATLRTLKMLHPDLEDRTAEVSADVAAGYRRARALKARAEAALAGFEAKLRAQMGSANRAACDGERVATRVISEVAERTQTVAAHRRDYLLAPRGKR